MTNRPSLDDYVDVAERIQDFKDAHPDGSLETGMWSDGEWFKVVEVDGKTFIVYRAEAYRTPDDPRPGHGIAWEPFPGKTPYTKDSELMNAETAAWGRAIVALGLVSNRSLASRQEVRNRREDQDADAAEQSDKPKTTAKPKATAKPAETSKPADPPEPVTEIVNDVTVKGLVDTIKASGKTDDQVAWCLLSVGVESLPENPSREDLKTAILALTVDQALRLDELLTGTDGSVPGSGEAS